MADVEDLMASASSSYDECCPSVVDPATLLALLAGIALATYFLRIQIVVLMRGKRSLNALPDFKKVNLTQDHDVILESLQRFSELPDFSIPRTTINSVRFSEL